MMTGGYHRSRGISNASFRRRLRPDHGADNIDAGRTIDEAASQVTIRSHSNFTRTFANVLEAIGAIGFCGALYLFFRDKALALRVLIGSTVTAGIGVAVNLGITLMCKLRGGK